MAENERIAALETRVESLENRMTKLESSNEDKAEAFANMNTNIQLLGQKFDDFIKSLEKEDNNKKFNWTQLIGALGIVIALGTTVWATNKTIKQTIQTNTSQMEMRLSSEDIERLTQSVLDKIED